jgi:hypothetical protein
VAVASDGVGETGVADGMDGGVRLGLAANGDDGRDVGVGVVSSPPQATAARTAMARETASQLARKLALLISNLH